MIISFELILLKCTLKYFSNDVESIKATSMAKRQQPCSQERSRIDRGVWLFSVLVFGHCLCKYMKENNHAQTHTHTIRTLICGVENAAVAVPFNCFAKIYLLLIIAVHSLSSLFACKLAKKMNRNGEKREKKPTKNSSKKQINNAIVILDGQSREKSQTNEALKELKSIWCREFWQHFFLAQRNCSLFMENNSV